MSKKLTFILLLIMLILLLATFNVLALFPEKEINYLLCFNPGGETDLTAQAQQKELEKILGVEVKINYKIGGGGALGWSKLVKSKADGYTAAGFNLPHIILQPLLNSNIDYKTESIEPVFIFNFTPNILAVHKKSPFKNLSDFIDYAEKNPGLVTIGGSGSYSANHIGTLKFNHTASINTKYIPFTGSGEAVPALLGQHVDALMTYAPMAIRNSGQMRVLAVAAEERIPAMPETATFKELGFDYLEGAYRGMAVPPQTPAARVEKLAAANLELTLSSSFKKKLEDLGFTVLQMGPKESEDFIKERSKYYRKIIAELKIKTEKHSSAFEEKGSFSQGAFYGRGDYAWK